MTCQPRLPRDKHDTQAAQALVALEWEQVACVVPQILEWMQDSNWPVAAIFRPFLIAQGARLAPCIKLILATDDATWKYCILEGIVRHSPALASALDMELQHLASFPAADELQEGVTALAHEILA